MVSISLGRTGRFVYRRSFSKKHGERSVTLRSGDVLVFGGQSRRMPHGLASLEADDGGAGPEWAAGKRVCVTLRER